MNTHSIARKDKSIDTQNSWLPRVRSKRGIAKSNGMMKLFKVIEGTLFISSNNGSCYLNLCSAKIHRTVHEKEIYLTT